jgi:23S rRNA pseudouridine1911/1915/1917 synthase
MVGKDFVADQAINPAVDKPCTMRVKPEQANARLDAVLEELFPAYGLRGRRRLWKWCEITVDGKVRKGSFRVKGGEEIAVAQNMSARPPALFSPALTAETSPEYSGRLVPAGRPFRRAAGYEPQRRKPMQAYRPRIITAGEDFAAFGKIEGVASAALAGGGKDSVEAMLDKHWPEIWKLYAGEQNILDKPLPARPFLCNRLDAETSGLLTAAFSADKADAFRLCERAGKVKKKYLALVHGLAPEYLLMHKTLDTYRRRSTLVLQREDLDYTRHTRAVLLKNIHAVGGDEPASRDWKAALRYLMELSGSFSLLEVTILRGARHQIRAHLSDAGFPIVGDSLYGPASSARAGRMFLHHFSVDLPGFQARWMPDWDLSGIDFTW